jgi:hypothetical protein
LAELSYTSASQLAAAIKAKKLSSREALEFFIGRRYADLDVIAASAMFERLRPWQHTYEKCKSRAL